MRQVFVLILVVVLCALLGNLLMGTIFLMGGIDLLDLLEGADLEGSQRILFRVGLILNHLCMFLVPSLVYLTWFDIGETILSPRPEVPVRALLLWGLTMLVSYPLLGQLAIWNAALPIPESLMSSQEDSFALIQNALDMNGIGELFLSILLVGVAAAIGEEFLFRGILQNFLERRMARPILAVLIAAIIFGAFHMQMERVLPLAFLGFVLGLSYYYTKNIWVPIILHFANNTVQVIGVYITTRDGEIPDIDGLPEIPMIAVLLSILLSLAAGYLAIKQVPPTYEPRP